MTSEGPPASLCRWREKQDRTDSWLKQKEVSLPFE